MAKVSTQISLSTVNIDRQSEVPLFRQLYDSLREAILNGQLAAGFKLPGSREMARDFGVSRNTVASAFDQLTAEGYLESQIGSGTFVSKKIPDDLLYSGEKKNVAPKKNGNRRRGLSARGELILRTPSGYGSETAPPTGEETNRHLAPFSPCVPSIADFPFEIWSKIVARRLRRPNRSLFYYGETAGYYPLREAIAMYLGAARGVRCQPEQLIVVSGAQQAVDLTARILLNAEDAVWVEDPGYLGTRGALTIAGGKIVPVPIDDEGLSVEAGKKIEPAPRLISVTPSHQYPLGVTMSLKRRLELLEWAGKTGAWILEDDYDSEYRYEGRPLAALQGLDANKRVIYVGTFSKVLAPALRIGYLVAPPDLVQAFTAAKALTDRHSPILEQMVLADFFNEGHFARHVRKMRLLYAERREWLISAVKSETGGLLEIEPTAAGLHLIGWLPPGMNDEEAARAAARNGVDCEPLSALSIVKPSRPGLVLGYASFSENEIKSGIKRLADALEKLAENEQKSEKHNSDGLRNG